MPGDLSAWRSQRYQRGIVARFSLIFVHVGAMDGRGSIFIDFRPFWGPGWR